MWQLSVPLETNALGAVFAAAKCALLLSAADDRREQAEELLELADALAEAAAAATITAGQPSIGIPWQAKQQALASKGAAVAAAAATCGGAAANAAAAGTGALPDALTAAQQLLAFGGVHVANVTGLGFTQVVSSLDVCSGS